jgi:RNA polymerase sigma-70 factor (ECF subfamily)
MHATGGVLAARGGLGMQRERFAVLVTPHSGVMLRAAAVLVGPLDAEDAVQEALLHAWRGWATLRDEAAVRSWLLRITANVCGNWQAGHFGTHRRRSVPLDLTGFPSPGLSPEGDRSDLPHGAADDPFARSGPGSASHASALDLRRAVSRLDTDLCHVVALRFYAGMDATAIGALLDIPPATVRTRLRRALLQLRERLDPPSLSPTLTHEIPTAPTHERGK